MFTSIVLLLPLVTGFKYLITNPTIGYSHVKYNSKVADVLADAGHNVTILQYYHIPMNNLKGLVKNPNVEIIHYYPDNIEKLRKAPLNTLPEFWATKSMDNPVLGYFVKPGFFAGLMNNTYSKLLRDTEFLKQLEDRRFDAVLAETFEVGGFYIAHLIKAPAVIATMSSVRYPYTEQLFGQPATLGYIPGDFSKMGKEATVWDRFNDIYYDFFTTISHKAYVDAQYDMYNSIVGYKLPHWQNLVTKSTFFITNTNSYLDFAIPKTANIIHVGGFTIEKNANHTLPDEYNKIMGGNTVIISFGSVVRSYEMPEEFKNGFIELFEAFPNVTFIWKYEKDDLEFKKRLGPNVHLKSWMPQAALLGDKRVKMFITHGGLASTMEVAYSGVPALVVPLFSDQFHNGMMLARHGGAIAYDKYELAKSAKLIDTVREILETPSFSENAKLLANVLHNQPTDPKQTLLNHLEFAVKFPNLKSLVPTNNFNNFIAFYYLDALFYAVAICFIVVFMLRRLTIRVKKLKND